MWTFALNLTDIQTYLASLPSYGKLVTNLERYCPPPTSIIFEAIFAYLAEKSGLRLSYEVRINDTNNKTVDFVHENQDYRLCLELVSPGESSHIKEAMTPKATNINGVQNYEILLYSSNACGHLRPEAQTIRLQEIIVNKAVKFPTAADNIYSIIVIDCSKQHFGHFDGDDCAMVMYGKTYNPYFQEFWGGIPILGLLNPSLTKDNPNYAYFRENISAVIFIMEYSYADISKAGLVLNCHRPECHQQALLKILKKYGAFNDYKFLPFPR